MPLNVHPGTVFIEDLLTYVLRVLFQTERQPSRNPQMVRDIHTISTFVFHDIIGDAIIKALETRRSNLARRGVRMAEVLRLNDPYPGKYLHNLLLRTPLSNFETLVLNREKDIWSHLVFRFMFVMTNFCLHFHRAGKLGLVRDMIDIAGIYILEILRYNPDLTMEWLKDYAHRFIRNEVPLHTIHSMRDFNYSEFSNLN